MNPSSPLPPQITLALRDLLWAKAKADDAPASAKTHLDSAIDWLAQVCDYQTEVPEESEMLALAREHMQNYRSMRERQIRFLNKDLTSAAESLFSP